MKIIVKKVGMDAEVVDVEEITLELMQELVGRLIEHYTVSEDVDMWMNDCGKLLGLQENIAIGIARDGVREVVDIVSGDIFFSAHNDEGDSIGLTEEQITWVLDKLDSGDFSITWGPSGLVFVPVWVLDDY